MTRKEAIEVNYQVGEIILTIHNNFAPQTRTPRINELLTILETLRNKISVYLLEHIDEPQIKEGQ